MSKKVKKVLFATFLCTVSMTVLTMCFLFHQPVSAAGESGKLALDIMILVTGFVGFYSFVWIVITWLSLSYILVPPPDPGEEEIIIKNGAETTPFLLLTISADELNLCYL